MINITNIQPEKKRIAWLDLTKLFAIFLVLFGHALQYLKTDLDPHYNFMWLFIYSFHMPLFMLISGFFSYSVLQTRFWELIKKKAIQLLLPCVLWGFVWYILKVFFVYHGFDDIKNNLVPDLKWLTIDVLWFLKSLFFCIVLCYCFKSSTWLLILSLFLSQLLPFKMPMMYPCFLVGLLCRHHNIFDRINFKWSIILVLLFIGLLCFFKPNYMLTNLRVTAIGVLDGNYLPFLKELWSRFYCLCIGIIGSLAIVSLCKILSTIVTKDRFWNTVSGLGSQTQAIYILHGPLIVYGVASFFNFNHLNIVLFDTVVAPTIALLLLVVCYFIINWFPSRTRMVLFGSRN